MAAHRKTGTWHSVLSLRVMLLAALTVPLTAQSTDVFSLTTPDSPVGTRWNSSVILPCELSPLLNVQPFEVRWYRPGKSHRPVILYKDHNIQKDSMDLQYRDRVSLTGGLDKGNVSLRLERVTLEDRGEYVCQVTSKQWYEKASVVLTVNVKGNEPVLSAANGGNGQVNVTCSSTGWSPEPKVTWRNKKGTEITNEQEVQKNTDPQGLVSVSSWILSSPSDSDWLSCTVSLSGEMLEGRILPNAPTQEKWRSAFITILVINALVVFGVIGLYFWNRKTEYFAFKKNPQTNGLKDKTESILNPAEKLALVTDEKDQKQESDGVFEKVKKSKVIITLDSTTAPPNLHVSEAAVTYNGPKVQKNITALHVLSEESFSSGQVYWEVDVQWKTAWYVGVATDKAETKAIVPLIPENGFWILGFDTEKGFHIPTHPEALVAGSKNLNTLGVTLDCDEHILSFYDVESKLHLYSFTDIGSNTFFCVFSPGSADDKQMLLKNSKN